MELLLLNGYIPHAILMAGLFTMGFAGWRYWVSDPMGFLLTPPWEGWIRGLFIAPGYPIYILGSALSILGPALLVFRWVVLHGTVSY